MGLTLGSTGCLSSFGASAEGERLSRMQQSPRWRDGVFENSLDTPQLTGDATMSGVLWDWLFGKSPQAAPSGSIPLQNSVAQALAQRPQSDLRVTWLGHSTLLIEIDGQRLLTDPVWGERASPSTIAGPKRFHAPPLPLEALPEVDAVLISHDHYDHLDMPTIEHLAARDVVFYAPLGVGAHLELWGVPRARIIEMDWWEEATVGSLKLVSTPARHFSGRGPFDRNATLWTSWTVLGPRHRVFFSGDTGPTPEFAQIGERFGPFDLTMIEVGAHHPAWGNIHLGPHEAMKAHKALQGRKMLPVHWGTFDLALHAWTEPAEILLTEAPAAGIELITPIPGQPIEPASPPPVTAWWRAVDSPEAAQAAAR
jgi:L-ascorbate metabolism protein UlaG (beta-lactamase superfamily)